MVRKGVLEQAAGDGTSEYRKIFDVAVDGLIVSDAASGCILEANLSACRMHGYTHEQLIGQDVALLMHPESRRQFGENLRSFELGAEFDVWTRLLRRDGSTSYSRWRGGRLEYAGRPCMLWSVRDVSERIQAEQALRQRMNARVREQSALLGISQTLASTLDFSPGLVLDQLRDLIPYDWAALFGMEGSSLVSLAVRVAPGHDSSTVRVPISDSEVLAFLGNSNRLIRISNAHGRSRPAAFLRSLINSNAPALAQDMQSWMWVPLSVRDGILGGIAMADTKKGLYTSHHANLALSVANQAVMTMVNAELYRNAQSTAAAHERQLLAQSLHDAVNQSLFSAGLIAEVLPRLWEQDQELARRSLVDLRRLMRGATAEMRALLAELRPSLITETDLGSMLHLLTDGFMGRTNIPIEIHVVGEGGLPGEVQVAIYRICQEALNNITKHAAASRVDVSLVQQADAIELEICDDGRGFDIHHARRGHGLSMLRERAEAADLLLSITSAPQKGTRLKVCWPKPQRKVVT